MVAYIKLSEKTDTNKGFITHEDRKVLSFVGYGDIFEVTGADKDIEEWANRVNGSKIDDKEAMSEIKIIELINLKAEILLLEDELTEKKKKFMKLSGE